VRKTSEMLLLVGTEDRIHSTSQNAIIRTFFTFSFGEKKFQIPQVAFPT
jgi:hypothetical protein